MAGITSDPVNVEGREWRFHATLTGTTVRSGFEWREGGHWRPARQYPGRVPLHALEPLRDQHRVELQAMELVRDLNARVYRANPQPTR